MRGGLQVRDRDAGVLKDRARPHLAEFGGDFRLELCKGRKDVIVDGILVPSLHPYGLTCSQRIVAGIPLLHSLLKECRRIRVDDDCRICFEVVYGLSDLHRVIVENGRIHGHETQMFPRLSR